MRNKMMRTGLALGLIAIFTGASFVAVTAQFNATSSTPLTTENLGIDMLIFISPQYAQDTDIETAIQSYISAVNDDLGWNTKIIYLTEENNDYQKIDETLESYYNLYNIKAAVMLGEDINTALAGDTDYMEKPSTVPWYTTGGVDDLGYTGRPGGADLSVRLIPHTQILRDQNSDSGKKTYCISLS